MSAKRGVSEGEVGIMVTDEPDGVSIFLYASLLVSLCRTVGSKEVSGGTTGLITKGKECRATTLQQSIICGIFRLISSECEFSYLSTSSIERIHRKPQVYLVLIG